MDTTTTDTTPVTTTEAAPAAPATSAPASPSTTSERPTDVRSLAAFLQKGATPTETPTASTETAATGPAVEAKPDGAHPNTDAKGPIPFEVHHKALANARAAAAKEATEQFEQEYGWAKQIPREALQEWGATARRMTTDPIGFLTDFVKELEAHPTHAQSLRSQAGRILASARGTPPADLSPDLVVDDGQGKQIATYSADRVKAIVAQAVNDALAKHVAPLAHDKQAREAAAAKVAAKQATDAKVNDVMSQLDELLEIAADTDADEKKTLYTALDALVAKGVDPIKAAMQVRKEHLEPMREKRAAAKALDSFTKKAAGNTANGRGTTATPTKLKDRKDIATFLRQRAGQ
ncbi:MAG TPA: hypothetical protein VGP95_16310 [Gemmatimonadaceae bacterium]|nr:hypothetical protein [Gemmatimonadaceae bacterium]